MKKVSCIIAAFNERARIAKVLEVVTIHPLVAEIIVVDDGSTDGTKEVVAPFKNVHLITHEKNQGKSRAVYSGIKESTGEFIFLLDADLIGLTAENLTAILEPVLLDIADVSISLRQNTPLPWRIIGLDYLSGERVFRRKMLSDQSLMEISTLPGFGLEVFLNKIIIRNRYRVKIVIWKNVLSPLKHKKQGLRKGLSGDVRMVKEIFQTISPVQALRQIISILRLRVD